MTSKERICAAWDGEPSDHVPLTTWCFGLPVPEVIQWERDGVKRKHWYSLRMEHLHTAPQEWTLEDDFQRILAWQSLGVDDLLDVSVPWSVAPEVTYKDSEVPAGTMDPRYPVMIRDYTTPSGPLRHAVEKTGEEQEPGWVTQPDNVPLFEDFNIPRGVEHAVARPEDIPKIRHLYAPPDERDRSWFTERMAQVKLFADKHGVAVRAWPAFGMDAAVWLAGTDGAIFMAMDAPEAFGHLMSVIAETDLARTELAASTPGVDMVVERGWYSSTDFWSPTLFDEFVYPHVEALARVAHTHGKKFGYVMTTGVATLGHRLADAGVDVLHFIDPLQDKISLESMAETLGSRMTLVGGMNALSLQFGDQERIRSEVRHAIECLGPTNRFILHPVDSLFPDTSWEGVEILIDAWKKYR